MFYYIPQNGNGGFFVEDLEKGICENIIIEAHSAADAVARLLSIGESVAGFYDFNSSVCGERWSWTSETVTEQESLRYMERSLER